jgi:hypothetical protein
MSSRPAGANIGENCSSFDAKVSCDSWEGKVWIYSIGAGDSQLRHQACSKVVVVICAQAYKVLVAC